jgi:hypothetical protein
LAKVFADDIMVNYTGTAPYAIYMSSKIYDNTFRGNNNGYLDPGETANLTVTLKNVGGVAFTNMSSTISESDPYVTINDNSGYYGSIPVNTAKENTTDPYVLYASPSAPIGYMATIRQIVVDGTYRDTFDFPLMIGRPMPTDTGYYYAYFCHGPYAECPVYSWYAIDTTQTQHVGTSLDPGDDQTFTVNIPFTFKYYGVNYTQISICSNGWIAMGATTAIDYYNYGIPNIYGPAAMVAALWDDLYPAYIGYPGDVYYYSDATNHRFVVEWFKVPHISYPTTEETFEIFLLDPIYYPTPTGDGEIIVQYKNAMKETDNTIGIENLAQTVGVQYFYEGVYHPWAVAITDTHAIKFTPKPPSLINVDEALSRDAVNGNYRLTAAPNPSFGRITIQYTVSSKQQNASSPTLQVFDASGRLVKSFNHLTIQPINQLVWDGSDDMGRQVSGGVYFVRLGSGIDQFEEKVILLK